MLIILVSSLIAFTLIGLFEPRKAERKQNDISVFVDNFIDLQPINWDNIPTDNK